MMNQSKSDVTSFNSHLKEVLSLIILMLLFLVGQNAANASESLLDKVLKTGDFKSKKLGYESLAGHTNLVIQAEPRSKSVKENLGYAKIKAWYDTEDKLTRKIVLLDDNENILSTVVFVGIKQYKGRNKATHMEVTNHKTGKTYSFDITKNDQFSYMM